MSTTHAPRFVFSGCPSFFRALCREATRGGADGYFRPGHELKRHVDHLQPDDASDEDWADATGELQALAFERARDGDGCRLSDRAFLPSLVIRVVMRGRGDATSWASIVLADLPSSSGRAPSIGRLCEVS